MVKKFMLICFGAILLSACFCQLIIIPKATSSPAGQRTVVIDAGHGGIDVGVTGVSTGVNESEINLAVAKILKTQFEAEGFKVVMTRTSEGGLYGPCTPGFKDRDLKKRVEITKNAAADLFISVHMNKYKDGNRRGAQVFYKNGCEKSKALALCVQDQLNGMDEASRECSVLAGDYYVLNYSLCPAVLVECGFLSSVEDERLLIDQNYQEKLAHRIYYGAVKAMVDGAL